MKERWSVALGGIENDLGVAPLIGRHSDRFWVNGNVFFPKPEETANTNGNGLDCGAFDQNVTHGTNLLIR